MPEDPWPAPTAAGPVHASITVPGSKSLANRALILASLADGPSTITGLPLGARDIDLMGAALASLGAGIEVLDRTTAAVTPAAGDGNTTVDCGLAGTVMRFVPVCAALRRGRVTFDGDPRARERPMAQVIDALRQLEVTVGDGGTGRLPFTVHGTGSVTGGRVVVDASASSQFVSALLLAAARFDRGADVHHLGDPVPSLPHIDMTCRMLAEHGIPVAADVSDRTDAHWQVSPGVIRAYDRVIEPDLSNAAPFAALALLTGGSVVIRDWPDDSAQPAFQLLGVLRQLGATERLVPEGLQISGGDPIHGIVADLRDLGELVPTVAALCALASSPSRLTGIGHIAGHETDRLTALADEINGLGGDVAAEADGLLIRPRPLHGGRWRTYSDHRMATAGAILGAAVPGVEIEDVATTAKTFPGFAELWRATVAPNTDRR